MVYYILLKGDPKEAVMYDDAILGETTSDGKKFYPNRGFRKFLRIVNKAPSLLENVEIYDDSNKQLTVEQFLKILEKTKIQTYSEE